MAERSKALESGYSPIQSERARVRISLLSNHFDEFSSSSFRVASEDGWVRIGSIEWFPGTWEGPSTDLNVLEQCSLLDSCDEDLATLRRPLAVPSGPDPSLNVRQF